MGLSVSAASAVLFIAFVVVFGATFSALDQYQQKMGSAYNEIEDRSMDIRATSIEFVAVDDTNDTFTIANCGETVLNIDDFDILINGTLIDPSLYSVEVIDHPTSRLVLPDEQVIFHLNIGIDNYRIKVITTWGISTIHTGM